MAMIEAPRLSRWSIDHLALTAEAAARLVQARLRLRSITFTKLPPDETTASVTARQLGRGRMLASAVNAAARRSPMRVTCVHRSLALWWMLRARGIRGELRIGIVADRVPFGAHAWVQCAGEALNETPEEIRRYGAFTEAVVPNEGRTSLPLAS
jgi:hypothetical protein